MSTLAIGTYRDKRQFQLGKNVGGKAMWILESHRAGLLPTLIDCRTTPQLLKDIITELLGESPMPVAPTVRELFDKHEGNIQNAIRELYDLCAGT